VYGPLLAAAVALPAFLWREAHSEHPMLPLGLFKIRNFSVVNAATLTIYGGLGALTFFLIIYLQQVGGYNALEAGLAFVPTTVVMFLLSRRFGALSMSIGPRLPMTIGPLLGGAGLLLLRGVDSNPDYVTEVLPGIVVFALGLAMTVAPLTAAVLSAVPQHNAGIASGVNNAVARVAGLLAIAVVGAIVSSTFESDLAGKLPARAFEEARTQPLVTTVPDSVPPGQRAEAKVSLTDAGVDAFRAGVTVSALLVAAGGVISAAGVQNRPRPASVRVSEATAPASTP
jgi:hypothetical protein